MIRALHENLSSFCSPELKKFSADIGILNFLTVLGLDHRLSKKMHFI